MSDNTTKPVFKLRYGNVSAAVGSATRLPPVISTTRPLTGSSAGTMALGALHNV